MTKTTNVEKLVSTDTFEEIKAVINTDKQDKARRIRKAKKMFFQFVPIDTIVQQTAVPSTILYKKIHEPGGWLEKRQKVETKENAKLSQSFYGMAFQTVNDMFHVVHLTMTKVREEAEAGNVNFLTLDVMCKNLLRVHQIMGIEKSQLTAKEIQSLNPEEVINTFMRSPFFLRAQEKNMLPPPTERPDEKEAE